MNLRTCCRVLVAGVLMFVTAAGSLVSHADPPPTVILQSNNGHMDCSQLPYQVDFYAAGYHWVCTNPQSVQHEIYGAACEYKTCVGSRA